MRTAVPTIENGTHDYLVLRIRRMVVPTRADLPYNFKFDYLRLFTIYFYIVSIVLNFQRITP